MKNNGQSDLRKFNEISTHVSNLIRQGAGSPLIIQ